MKCWLTMFLLPVMGYSAGNYTAERALDHGVAVIRLTDSERGMRVVVAPSIGNRALEFSVHDKNILYFPPTDIGSFRDSGATQLNGVPFLAPWANRMAGSSFWANGKNYRLNPDIGSLRISPDGIAIHGMLTASRLWEVLEVTADAHSAHVISRLQFWKYPELMANWPFAHEYQMTYTLADGMLEVSTKVTNLSSEPMPVSVGFHPYFRIPDVPREEASVHIPAHKHVQTDGHLVATGELVAADLAESISLKDHTFDDGYTDLSRGGDGRAVFWVEAGGKKIEVLYGPKFPVAVVFAPPKLPFVCFEPMTAITNGVNLAHEGKFSDLQTVASGSKWEESFWIRPSGF